jgi:hypothetical protein
MSTQSIRFDLMRPWPFRYCGGGMEVGERKYQKFGEPVDFALSLAAEIILGGGSIVPAKDPAWKEFTEQELSLYSNPLSHGEANPSFLAKKKRVQLVCHELRMRLEAGETPEQVLGDQPDPAPAPAPAAN